MPGAFLETYITHIILHHMDYSFDPHSYPFKIDTIIISLHIR